MPLLSIFPATECEYADALKEEAALIKKLPFTTQFDDGVIPATFVFVILILVKNTGVPDKISAPAPPKTTVPVLEKLVPRLTGDAEVGRKLKVPLLVMVPLLVVIPSTYTM